MKTIGLLGGTGWSSTIGYYKLLNELVNERLGGYHSAKILLKSIDYHDIMTNYGNHERVSELLKTELNELFSLKPDCVLICCNSLHKYYDLIKTQLNSTIPVMHAVELIAKYAKMKNFNRVLLLATKFTMEDGFFENILKKYCLTVIVPDAKERVQIHQYHNELMQNTVTESAKQYFNQLIEKYSTDIDAVILGCTEFPLVVNQNTFAVPVIDPVYLQAEEAVNYSL